MPGAGVGDADVVDGALSYVPSAALLALDDFEGDDYARVPVDVVTCDGVTVRATAWVWIAGAHWLNLNAEWIFEDFVKERLQAWLAMSDEDFLVAGETRFQPEPGFGGEGQADLAHVVCTATDSEAVVHANKDSMGSNDFYKEIRVCEVSV